MDTLSSPFKEIDNSTLYPSSEQEDGQRLLTISEMDSDDRPFERAMKYGVKSLSTPDLWALILRSGRPNLPITTLCRTLMKLGGGTLHSLERRTQKELLEIDGIGPVKAAQIQALFQLIKNYMEETMAPRIQIRNSVDIYNVMLPKIGNLPHEEIWALYLNQGNKLTAALRVTSGTSVASILDLKKIMKHALLEDAQAMVLCHNHPSGTLRPSVNDDRITKTVKEGCTTLDIRLIDHVIVTANGYYSYSDSDKLPR